MGFKSQPIEEGKVEDEGKIFTVTYANGDSMTYNERDLAEGFDETCSPDNDAECSDE